MTIQDDINRLFRPPRRRALTDIAPRSRIGAARGAAPHVAIGAGGGAPAGTVLRREVVTVYSSIILTEDGAFERPLIWRDDSHPDTGKYPTSATPPHPLPSSLILDAGVLKLDDGVPHYEQRRVHLVLYDVADVMHEDWYAIPIAWPFTSPTTTHYFQGTTNVTGSPWLPALAMRIVPGSRPAAIDARIAALQAAGVALVP